MRAGLFFTFVFLPWPVLAGENAATQYLLAAMGCSVPKYVDNATTDDLKDGFTNRLSVVQKNYLDFSYVKSTLARFDHASVLDRCEWELFTIASWDDENLYHRLHQLARVVLLRARSRFESGMWIEGNRDIANVQLLSRRMVSASRPWNHTCFMIENMAIFTAGAYLLEMPQVAIEDLVIREQKLRVFAPMADLMKDEATRLRQVVKDYRMGEISRNDLMVRLDPILENANPLTSLSQDEFCETVTSLASYFDELAETMIYPQAVASVMTLSIQSEYAKTNVILSQYDSTFGLQEWLENAQANCRSQMLREVLSVLADGKRDFSTIDDPYGEGFLELSEEPFDLRLVSELETTIRIDFRFGSAGLKANPME